MNSADLKRGQVWATEQINRIADEYEVTVGEITWSTPSSDADDAIVKLTVMLSNSLFEERFTVANLSQIRRDRKIRARIEHRIKAIFKSAGFIAPEDDDVYDEAEAGAAGIEFQYAITSYGADYPVDGLVKRLSNDDIFIPTFQRRFVWTSYQSSRFIESLLLGLPVPAIFLGKEDDTNRLLVIDGQQRLRSLWNFYKGRHANGEEFILNGVANRYEGLSYLTLPDSDRRRLDDSILHAIVVKQDQPDEDHNSSIYLLFERLNTGGSLLHPQEIRACVYYGPLNDLLSELNTLPAWRAVYGLENQRMKDVELILRFFTLLYDSDRYSRPMEGALNRYMSSNRKLQRQSREELTRDFSESINLVERALGAAAFRPIRAINAAVFDSVMVAVAKRLRSGALIVPANFQRIYDALLADPGYQSAYQNSTADEEKLATRLRIASSFFSSIA
jgi:hypothetical protein